jgi:hypothetical protein
LQKSRYKSHCKASPFPVIARLTKSAEATSEWEILNNSKIKMTTQNAKFLTFALSFCTFIFALYILKGFMVGN